MSAPEVAKIHAELLIHHRFHSTYQKFISKKDPKCVWEIGALDGLDSVSLKNEFPSTQFIAFEPTPDSFKITSRNLLSIRGGDAFQIALSDANGVADFMVNDPDKTVTTWKNGNQGANSLFKANPNYPPEKYWQNIISIKTSRADSLIESGLVAPDVLWVDAQGSELMIFQGFGDYIKSVVFIYVELSLFSIYLNSPLAIEVVKYLSQNGFLWTTNLTKSGYQFDAVFLKPKKRKKLARIKHQFFLYSLNTYHKLYISMNLAQFIRAKIKQLISSTMR